MAKRTKKILSVLAQCPHCGKVLHMLKVKNKVYFEGVEI